MLTAVTVGLSVTGGGAATADTHPPDTLPGDPVPLGGPAPTVPGASTTTLVPSSVPTPPPTTTTVAPVGVEPVPVPDAGIPAVSPPAPAAATEPDIRAAPEGGGWDGESPLATMTALTGPGAFA